jgi:hypothetical protein
MTTTHFLMFGNLSQPEPSGRYERLCAEMTYDEVRGFCRNVGDGFWSLVRGGHETIVATIVCGTSVTNQDRAKSKSPEPAIGDFVMLIVPARDWIAQADTEIPGFGSLGEVPPMPKYVRFEKWVRTR